MTIKPATGVTKDPDGAKLLTKMKDLAKTAAKDEKFIVQVRVTPKDKAAQHHCTCSCCG